MGVIGVVLMAHGQLGRSGQVARHLARQGCRVAVHVDTRTGPDEMARFEAAVSGNPDIVLSPRKRSEWGSFSLVEACLDALRLLFRRWPEITHVCQLSGSCLPIKPIAALEAHLVANPGTDFIESVSVEDEPWVVDGLSKERFSLYHPFCWRRQQWLFDRNVELQRALGVRRRMPDGLVPRIGSQWWCLSRPTLDAILSDPDLPAFCRFFRRSWIPDESFFQTLAGKHSRRMIGTPLTLARFDPQGKPYVFYDDHRDMLLDADAFFARKIWAGAQDLYRTFLDTDLALHLPETRDGGKLLRRFDRATNRHRQGRRGLISQGRHPGRRKDVQHETARPYFVIDGPQLVCPDLMHDLGRLAGVVAHGALFAKDRVEFAGNARVFTGNLTDSARIRDHKPVHFLSKLIWIERDRAQCFVHDFTGAPVASAFIARDPNARVIRLADGWLLDLHATWRAAPQGAIAAAADRLEAAAHVSARLEGGDVKARILTLGLQEILHGGRDQAARLAAHLPHGVAQGSLFSGVRLPDGFGDFLEELDAAGAGTAGLHHLLCTVRAFEQMNRVLRRKT